MKKGSGAMLRSRFRVATSVGCVVFILIITGICEVSAAGAQNQAPQGAEAAGASFNTSHLNFGTQAVGERSAGQSVTLTNSGSGPLRISNIALAVGSQYAIGTKTCAATLAAGASCKVTVTFAPTSDGIKTDSLIFRGGEGSPQVVYLKGNGRGVIPPEYFGNQMVGWTRRPWFNAPTSTIRLSCDIGDVAWGELEANGEPGKETFQRAGEDIDAAIGHGFRGDMTWHFSAVPSWITSNPDDTLGNPNQHWDPPNDVCSSDNTWHTFKHQWQAQSYDQYDGVSTSTRDRCGRSRDEPCNDQVWFANAPTSASDVPGQSPKWVPACTNAAGSNAKFRKFVTDLMNARTPKGQKFTDWVKIYESWWGTNTGLWHGTLTQLRRMQEDAWEIIHAACADCVVLSPTPENNGGGAWTNMYLQDGDNAVMDYTDGVGIHAYTKGGSIQSPAPIPETIVDLLTVLRNGVSSRNATSSGGSSDTSIEISTDPNDGNNITYYANGMNVIVTPPGTTYQTSEVRQAQSRIRLYCGGSSPACPPGGRVTVTSVGLKDTPYRDMAVYDMESSWATQLSSAIPNPNDRAGFWLRHELLGRWDSGSKSVLGRMYWWAWDQARSGREWSPDRIPEDGPGECTTPYGGGYLCSVGLAWPQGYHWLVGKSVTSCSTSNSIWSCSLSDGNAIVWSAAETSYNVSVSDDGMQATCDNCFAKVKPAVGTYVYVESGAGGRGRERGFGRRGEDDDGGGVEPRFEQIQFRGRRRRQRPGMRQMPRGGRGRPVIPLMVASVPDNSTITFQSAYEGGPGAETMTWHDYTLRYNLQHPYSTETDIYGKESAISGSTVNVGYAPVLLSNGGTSSRKR